MPISGSKMPDMGMKTISRVSEAAAEYARANLSDALFTHTQQRVLACLFGQPGQTHTVSELIQKTGAGSGAVQREVARLAGSGLLKVEKRGNRKFYRANPDCPIHDELASIVRKTFGLATPLREVLAPFSDQIRAAFVYGSVARNSDTSSSDIDLMVVTDVLGYAELMAALHPAIERLGRVVNPSLYTPDEMRSRISSGNGFISNVMAGPKLWLLGSEHDLSA